MSDSIVQASELRLVEAAARGDRDARRELFERYREAALRVAMRVTGREADALDVVQDSYIKAFESLGSFAGESSFKTWLLRIVHNKALDHLRSRRVRLAARLDADDERPAPAALVPATDGRPERSLDRAELRERLERAIAELPPDQRAVFALYASGELTYGQIAEIVGVPIGTVMSRIFHARRRLHERLADLAPPATERSER